MMARMFKAFEFGTQGQQKSAMKKMEELVAKAARTLTPEGKGTAEKQL